MTTVYIKNGKEFSSELALRRAYPELIFPKLTDEVMAMVGVTKEEREEEKTVEQIAAEVRIHRDALLRSSDYYVMPDYPSNELDMASVVEYRQALRDVPLQTGFPTAVQWPVLPDVLRGGTDVE